MNDNSVNTDTHASIPPTPVGIRLRKPRFAGIRHGCGTFGAAAMHGSCGCGCDHDSRDWDTGVDEHMGDGVEVCGGGTFGAATTSPKHLNPECGDNPQKILKSQSRIESQTNLGTLNPLLTVCPDEINAVIEGDFGKILN